MITLDSSIRGRSSRRNWILCFLVVATLTLPSAWAQRLPIPGVRNTGLDAAGQPVVSSGGIPYGVDGAWKQEGNPAPVPDLLGPTWMVAPAGKARWVGGTGQVASFNGTGASYVPIMLPGSYRYSLSFQMEGFKPDTAAIRFKVAADDLITDIRLNGLSFGPVSVTPFMLADVNLDRGFVRGTNTLEIEVFNGNGAFFDPFGLTSGLLVVDMEATAQPLSLAGVPQVFHGTASQKTVVDPRSLAAIGDLNGDGYEDFVVGVEAVEPNRGEVDVVFGGPHPQVIQPGQINGLNGVRITLSSSVGTVGVATVAGIGDYNGDGLADLALGFSAWSEQSETRNGKIFVIFGRKTSTGNEFGPGGLYDLNRLSARDKSLLGYAGDMAGSTISGAGDFNGDGYDDFVFSCTDGQRQHPRRVYLLLGNPDGSIPTLASLEIASTTGGWILKDAGIFTSLALSGAGDVNGDGYDDVIIGESGSQTAGPNLAYIIYGGPKLPFLPDTAPGAASRPGTDSRYGILRDSAAVDQASSVAGIGDFNGDGYDDVAIGGKTESDLSAPARAWILFGSPAGLGGARDHMVDLQLADPGQGITFGQNGEAATNPNVAEYRVSAAGDLDGDGFADLSVGAPLSDAIGHRNAGRIYLVRGGDAAVWNQVIFSLPNLGQPVVQSFVGPSDFALLGYAGSTGDLNGDGVADPLQLMIGVTEPVAGGAIYGFVSTNLPAASTNRTLVANGQPELAGSLTERTVGPRGFGRVGNRSLGLPFARLAIGFTGGLGGGTAGASWQTVALVRKAVPAPGASGTFKPAPVHWQLTDSDRRGFTAARLVFSCVPSEMEGLNPDSLDIWWTPSLEPDARTQWTPLQARRQGRTFIVDRTFAASAAGAEALLGTYAVMEGQTTYLLGSEIPRPPSVNVENLSPVIQPPGAVFFDPISKKLIAIKKGLVTIQWVSGTVTQAVTTASLQWPNDVALYQPYIVGTPPVLLTNYAAVILADTESDVLASSVSSSKSFVTATAGRSLLQLSPALNLPAQFQLIDAIDRIETAIRFNPGFTANLSITNETLGLDFHVSRPIVVRSLGFYDDGTPLAAPFVVSLVKLTGPSTGTVLTNRTFSVRDPGTWNGLTRSKALEEELVLPVGDYSILVAGYNATNRSALRTPDGRGWRAVHAPRPVSVLRGRRGVEPLQGPVIDDADGAFAAGTFSYESFELATVGTVIDSAGTVEGQTLHDLRSPGPFLLTRLARYCTAPGFFDPSLNRSGALVPVNVAWPGHPETELIVAYYQAAGRILTGTNGVFATNNTVFWPHRSIFYRAQWPAAADSIVIASQLGGGRLAPETYGTDWDLYFQNDPTLPGFNPNDEHARVANNIVGDRTPMPLRSDLGSDSTSPPYVLVSYSVPGSVPAQKRIRLWQVVAEDSAHRFSYPAEVGQRVFPPSPLATDAPCPQSVTTEDLTQVATNQRHVFTDRNGGLWAKSSGLNGTAASVGVKFFYPALESYYFPSTYPAPAAGGCVPWLDRYNQTPGTPVTVEYQIQWPANAPTLFLGETLVTPKRGLPAIAVPGQPDQGPCSVEIIYQQASAVDPTQFSAQLIDPVKSHSVPLAQLPTGILIEPFVNPDGSVESRFKGLPPHLSTRLSFLPTAPAGGSLRLRGEYVTPDIGEAYVLPNVLSGDELQTVRALAQDNQAWLTAVQQLNGLAKGDLLFDAQDKEKGLLALSAGSGTAPGFVVLAFGNHPNAAICNPAAPVSVSVIRVEGAFRGAVSTIPAACVFDERLTAKHTGDFGGQADQFFFQWALQPAGGEANQPAPVNPNDSLQGWTLVAEGAGLSSYTIGGANPYTLGDNSLICRYRPINNPNGWSQWTEPKQAFGWVKRVLEGIGPFEQRFKNLGDPAKTINTTVDMLAQAGPRWEGAVPLDCNNVDRFGLIEIYETVYQRATDFSIGAGISYQPANDALLLVASRLSDLYMLLGNEAFADASDPTVGLITDTRDDYIAKVTSMHAFQGLADAPDLLHEELVLLRGRGPGANPGVEKAPIYNRFPWNFSGGFGEVAYQLNYDIQDANGNFDGRITEADARKVYPQGHGDAWGHYLTALTYYYKLLRSPAFNWVPRTETIAIGGADVEVDFQEEQKFARSAAAKARTGAEIVNLTFRSLYVENPGGQWQGYKDPNLSQAWGMAEWAERVGQGAYFDWVVGNAILPPASTNQPAPGKLRVDRSTVLDLGEVAAAYGRIQAEVDNADQGLNPLGLRKNVVPFDLSASDLDAGVGHFEQVYSRALQAISTAVTVFRYAVNNAQNLRRQSDTLTDFQKDTEQQKRDYISRLIEIYGQPYKEDIGPGGTYPSGYTGPDILLHYDYVDPSPLLGVLTNTQDRAATIKVFQVLINQNQFDFNNGNLSVHLTDQGIISPTSTPVAFHFSDRFGGVKPLNWTTRLSSGELQSSRSDILQQAGNFQIALKTYQALLEDIQERASLLRAQFNVTQDKINIVNKRNNTLIGFNVVIGIARSAAKAFEIGGRYADNTAEAIIEALPKVVGTSTDVTSGARGAVKLVSGNLLLGLDIGAAGSETVATGFEFAKEGVENEADLRIQKLDGSLELQTALAELQSLIRTEAALRYQMYVAYEQLNQAQAKFTSTLAAGQRLLAEFIRFQLDTAAVVQKARYKNMAYRVFRNDALQKYRAQFDLAARYAYLAARAYDYETNFTPGDNRGPGEDFMTQIVRSRALGNLEDNDGAGDWLPFTGGAEGDPGLADALARMSGNWNLNLKPQLGFNNIQPDRGNFSLRYENFQILPVDGSDPATPSGQEADQLWRDQLTSYRVNDVLKVQQFNQFCIPFSPVDRQLGEPGLVIPFSTTINAGANIFGKPLSENQDQFDSTKFATKIRSIAILLDGLDQAGLSAQPLVYLVPVGADIMRTPSDRQNNVTRSWSVVDQRLPIPFPLKFARNSGNQIPADIQQANWIPSVNGLNGQVGEQRRHPTIKAFVNSPDLDLDNAFVRNNRLVGRSVWNTQWLLVIPGRLLFSDPAEGVERFINGRIDAATGQRSGAGIRDIRIVFETYAIPGQ